MKLTLLAGAALLFLLGPPVFAAPLAEKNGPYAFLAIVAHPDDESAYFPGTLVQLARKEGLKGALVQWTTGQKGGSKFGWDMDEDLKRVREKEMIAAAKVYGCDVFFMGNPDFGENHTPKEIYDDYWGWDDSLDLMVNVIRSLKPEFVVTLNPDHNPGSPAHRATAIIARWAVKKAAEPKYKPELGKPWKTKRLFAPDGKGGKFLLDVSANNGLMNRAKSRHASQGFEANKEPVKTERLTLLFGDAPPSASSLTAGLKGLLKRTYQKGFSPKVTRVYRSDFVREMGRRQEKRHDAFLASEGPYRFRFKEMPTMLEVRKPPVVDGDLKEFEKAPPLSLKDNKGKEAASLKFIWTPKGLALGATVNKSGPIQNESDIDNLWRGDAVELYLNPDPEMALPRRDWRTAWDRQYIFSPTSKDGKPVACGIGAGGFKLKGAKTAFKTVPGEGYRLEAWIPAANFKSWSPKKGDTFRFDIAVDVLEQGKGRTQTRWHDTKGESWMKPDAWGLIKVE